MLRIALPLDAAARGQRFQPGRHLDRGVGVQRASFAVMPDVERGEQSSGRQFAPGDFSSALPG